MIKVKIFLLLTVLVCCFGIFSFISAATIGTISSTDRYAYSENLGWIDFGSSQGDVIVTDTELTGYAWFENVGWISLNCSNDDSCGTVDYKVSNSDGVLSGYAYGENVGWINFDPVVSETDYGVIIASDGTFSGYAWGENTGWVSFNCSNDSSCGTVIYGVAISSTYGYQTVMSANGTTTVSVMVGKEILVSAPANFVLTGTIGGLTGGSAIGTAAFDVLNSSEAGFNMSINASTTPALATGSYAFSDYVPLASATPGSTYAAPDAGTSSFGFAVVASGTDGADAVQKFKYSSGDCNASGGTNSDTNCWVGFIGDTPIPVVSTSVFSSTVVTETISFKAAFTNDNVHTLAADTYTSTIIVTVATN